MSNKPIELIKSHIETEFKSLIQRTFDVSKNKYWVLNIEPNLNWIGGKHDTIIAYFWNTLNNHVYIINDLNSYELSSLLNEYGLVTGAYDTNKSIHTHYFRDKRGDLISEVEHYIKNHD